MRRSPRPPPCSRAPIRPQRNSTPVFKRFVKKPHAARSRLNKGKHMNAKLITGIALALSMAGCATAPITNAALENARSAVRSAESDPNVEKYAALDLHSARNELAEAEA